MENRSSFDSNRKTAGAIYRDAQMHGERGVIIGDVNYEMRKGLVEDINEAIIEATKSFEGKPFYLAIYEKSDLMLKCSIVRLRKATLYRPYPEQDSMVFKVIPAANEVYSCWVLPHRSAMMNMLATPELRQTKEEQEELQMLRHWENDRLEYYGFMKDENGHWVENPLYNGDVLMSEQKKEPKISLVV